MKTHSLLLVTVAAILYAVVTPATAIPREWGPIPYIQELGGWAVAEHVKQAKDGLKFSKVVGGDEQVVAGVNCRLVVDALNRDGKDSTYKVEVYELNWTNTRKLVSSSARPTELQD